MSEAAHTCGDRGDRHGSHALHSETCHHATARPAANSAPPRVKWTCPMHPQTVRDGPGACPICGMALEPVTPSAERLDNPELAAMTRRLWIGVALTVPVFSMEMSAHIP